MPQRPPRADAAPENITSAGNPLVKQLRSLERKKERAETGLFLAEGARLVEQGLARGWEIETLAVAATALERDYVLDLIKTAARNGARVVTLPERLISTITHKDNPQTAIAAFRQREAGLEALNRPGPGIWIALFEVRDPGNLGTILRTADCAGMAGVILIGSCVDPFSVETVRATMGSIFDMPIARCDYGTFNTWRREAGISLIAASVNGTVRHDRASYGDRCAILMGNEQAGLPPMVEATCDTLALIPMRGGADSLNLAQATAIMAFEAWRQHGYEGARA